MADRELLIVGAGVMGLSAAWQAARRGFKPLVLEQYPLFHDHGSSHGNTRIYRTVNFEGDEYFLLSLRAQQLWDMLAQESGQELKQETGALFLGPPMGRVVVGSIHAARARQVEHEYLDAEDLAGRFPSLRPHPKEVAVLDRQAGVLHADRCLKALASCAKHQGAEIATPEKVVAWRSVSGGVEVKTDQRTLTTESLVLTAGPWIGQLVPELASELMIERQTVFHFEPAEPVGNSKPPAMVPFIWEDAPGEMFYGIPDLGDGVKVAHHGGKTFDTPADLDRVVHEEDLAPVRSFVERHVPAAQTKVRASTTCIYSTPYSDPNFVISRHPHPANAKVILVSACSGKGFKFAPAIGEIVLAMSAGMEPAIDIAPFSMDRFD